MPQPGERFAIGNNVGAQFSAQMTTRNAELDQREAAVTTAEHSLAERSAALKADEADYEARMAQLETLGRRKRA